VLAERERVLGTDHLDTLTSRNNLAWAYQQAGDSRRAVLLFEAMLSDFVRVLGTDHPETRRVRNNLATARAAQNRNSPVSGYGSGGYIGSPYGGTSW
jgi:hypothetical protein